MKSEDKEKSSGMFRPHPWHGLDIGPSPPGILNVFAEITPYDLVKYEVDKVSGYPRVDRPQRGSSQPPALYGFVPRTYCGDRVKRLSPGSKAGDGDPLDIMVLCERPITRNEVNVRARVAGGLQMVDGDEADDKIISVLENDFVWGHAAYKLVPGESASAEMKRIHGCKHALKVVDASIEDYRLSFGTGPATGCSR
jgi:inorganic pyrophosphatase